jgi:transcriptional regulator with XRE-family HTH domain
MKSNQPPSVGRSIQHIRKQQQLTLGVLSERSGVSKAMLSQIESEKVNPTVATVWKIARGLNVELDALLKGTGASIGKFQVTRHNEITTLDTASDGPHLQVLSPLSMAEDLEIYLLTFDEGAVLQSSSHAPGTEEYLTVLDGRVRVAAGEREAELTSGDFIIYRCDVDHTIENTNRGTSRIHMIVRFARRRWE